MSGYAVRIRVGEGSALSFHAKTLDLDQLQAGVDGLIEPMFTIPSPSFPTNRSITGYVNEEGLLIGLPIRFSVSDEYGVRPFAGNMIVVGLNEDTGDTEMLSQNDAQWILDRFDGSVLNLLP